MRKRRAGGAIVELGLDPSAGVPRYRQLYQRLREAILAGRLGPGTRLPSTRTLARELGCARITVMGAFEQLTAEGYLEGRVGAGTTVAKALPGGVLGMARGPRSERATRRQARVLSARGASIVRVQTAPPAPTCARPFRVGVPARDIWPAEIWARLVARWARRMPAQLFEYGDVAGYRPLREAIAAYVRAARAVHCDADQVVIVSGSQQGIDLTARLLLDPGDQAWVEEPGYPNGRAVFAAAGVRLCPIPVDAEGLDVRAGASRAAAARLVYVTPSHQFPLGVTMTLPRRLALLEWARRTGAWVLEDDHNSEYRYTSRPLAALQGLDAAGRVVYLGTFSKVLFPALRLGYLIVPPRLVDAFVAARTLMDRHPPTAPQAALADFIGDGHFARHVRRSRAIYAERQAILVEAARSIAGRLDVSSAEAGMHLVGRLGRGCDDRQVAIAARAYGVEVSPLSAYHLRPGGRRGLLLGYAAYPEREIREAVQRLARALGAVTAATLA